MESKKVYSFRLNEKQIKSLKYLAVDLDRFLGDLLEEAIDDIIKKYGSKAPSPKKFPKS